jgi:SAM-dependent methyltransferase
VSGSDLDAEAQRRAVRERYGSIAGDGCCGDTDDAAAAARAHGYDDEAIDAAPDDSMLGLGCGNPGAIADLKPGETVLDLGAGAGFDCFLAADAVGPDGRVIGVDMTPEMVERARANAADDDLCVDPATCDDDADGVPVEFRLGEIEHLPVADGVVDVAVSNCVVNLSPDKPQVFREAFRVLRPGGRVAISDVVRTAELPHDLRADPDSVSACVAGAATVDRLEAMLADAGFVDVRIEPDDDSAAFIREWDADRDPSEFVRSASIEARKPAADGAATDPGGEGR